jgi:hypothetical protein
MKRARHTAIDETELASINASAEATLALEAEDWDDAAREAALDCARLCESHARGGMPLGFELD